VQEELRRCSHSPRRGRAYHPIEIPDRNGDRTSPMVMFLASPKEPCRRRVESRRCSHSPRRGRACHPIEIPNRDRGRARPHSKRSERRRRSHRHFPSRIETPSPVKSAPPLIPTAKSSLPSPLRSPTATETGQTPRLKFVAGPKEPVPSPRRMETLLLPPDRAIRHGQIQLPIPIKIPDRNRRWLQSHSEIHGRSEGTSAIAQQD